MGGEKAERMGRTKEGSRPWWDHPLGVCSPRGTGTARVGSNTRAKPGHISESKQGAGGG